MHHEPSCEGFFVCSKFSPAFSVVIPNENFSSCQCMQHGAHHGTTRTGSSPCTLRHLPSLRYVPFLQGSRASFLSFFSSFFSRKHESSVTLANLPLRVFFFFFCGFLEKFEMNDAWFAMLEVIQE